jgi:hypothetical protein
MKKVLLAAVLAFSLFSCEIEEIIKEPEIVIDCNCDKIVDQATFNIPGPDQKILVKGSTVNECTKQTKEFTYTIFSSQSSSIQKIGACKK